MCLFCLFVQPASTDGKRITLVTLNEGNSKVLDDFQSNGNPYLALRYAGYSFYEKATILKDRKHINFLGGGGGGGWGGAEVIPPPIKSECSFALVN